MLENTAFRLKHGLGLTVAYFGGSITEGAGASSYGRCYAALTTAWLKEKYPGCEIRHVQAAVGGTDSTFGVFRCDRDVCSQKPDLIFYEFAVNDSGMDFLTAVKNAEACIRKVRSVVPSAEFVTVYTITRSLADRMAAGGIQPAKTAHGAVSEVYGVPEIDVGEALRHRVLAEGSALADESDWKRYTTDTVHPNDAGYEIYAETIRRKLGGWLENAEDTGSLCEYPMPEPLIPDGESHMRARMIDCREAETDGNWTVRETPLCGRYPRYIECLSPGGELTFSFRGRRIDLCWMMAKDSGDAMCSVDGGDFFTVRSWDHYCKSFNRANAACVARDLPEGDHVLRLRVSAARAEESEGTAVRIGAFLVL